MKARKIIARLLAAFLLVSIGVAVGREMSAGQRAWQAPPGVKVVVYYLHGKPCRTCTFIKDTAAALVAEEFADAVQAGRLKFVPLNFLDRENQALAERYNVGGNMVIAVRFQDGREVARARLDGVMALASDGERLRDYLRDGIRSVMPGEDQ